MSRWQTILLAFGAELQFSTGYPNTHPKSIYPLGIRPPNSSWAGYPPNYPLGDARVYPRPTLTIDDLVPYRKILPNGHHGLQLKILSNPLEERRGRASSSTRPVDTPELVAKQTTRTPVTASEDHGQELSINELISQYSESKPAANSTKKQRYHDDWREEDESWTNIRQHQSRRDLRYQDKEHRKPVVKNEEKREEINRSALEPRPPTLAQMLTHVEDSRQWLEASSYKNAPKRDKILSRQREIAALDAERDKLIAEIKAEGPLILPAVGNHTPNFTIPPAASEKVGHRAAPVPKTEKGTAATQYYRVVPSKRRYNDVQDDRAQASTKKLARPGTDDRGGHGRRIKEEEDTAPSKVE
ncbi:hypothetical protein DL95DRAFT_451596 [Leptodontidium sp. 2 PMI_412]|nr:hypothetical protein DL95DRAFT_451596 [Leptodontidium sp. 2 PMI_412]